MSTNAPAPGPADEGQVLGGRYRLEHVIGRGGMATVYQAIDEDLGRPVAVKVFHQGRIDPARQEAELSVLASLDHHGLVNLLDAGTTPTGHGFDRYLVMALVTGDDLETHLSKGPLSSRHIAEIGYDMAEALDYIHSHGVIHRDIKPSNILLVDYGDHSARARAKLTDFGIALTEDVERLTAEGATTGTAAYLSPEQARGGTVGPSSDVYSLGLVLLQCFTRRREFPGSLVESAIARLSRDPVIPEPLPEHWRTLLTAMTRQDPAQRPTGAELVSLMRQVVITDSSRHRDQPDPTEATADRLESGMPHSDALDTLPAEALRRTTVMAARLFDAPISIVSILDHDRTWFHTHFDDRVPDTARNLVQAPGGSPSPVPVIIHDATSDARAKNSPLVTGTLGLRFYASVPIARRDGTTIGTLAVLDTIPRTASDTSTDTKNLDDLAALITTQLELRHESIRSTGDALRLPHTPAPGNTGDDETQAL